MLYVIKNMKFNTVITILSLLMFFLVVPTSAEAARYDVAAWIPWFADQEEATKSARRNIDELDVIYPFVFEVNSDGSLRNRVNFNDDHWEDLFDEAEDERVDVIPTIAWFDGAAIHEVLSDKRARRKHVKEIAAMVEENDFAGVNIDYEQKRAATINYFSTFLEELKDELGRRKELTCTVEARTPAASLYREIPEVIEYANDYEEMNEHCDWVEIMAYDQQRADIKLNDERRGVPYAPVADVDWVEKVIKLALDDFDEDKVMLGVATYGRAWDVTVAPEWYRDYTRVATLNQPRIFELSEKYDAPIGRTAGGEAVISYFPEDSVWRVFDALPAPKDTPKGFEAAAKALMVATYADIEIPVRFVTWSDAQAIEDKIDLVKKYDLRGVAVFKVDGEEDQKIWKLF